jgi:hypothetical protein
MRFARVHHREIVAQDLLGRIREMTTAEAQAGRAGWERLKTENADLRVLDASGIASAPITFFDALITSCITGNWQRCIRVMGEASHRSGNEYDQVGETFLVARLLSLIDTGAVEARGDLDSIRDSFVRLR